MRTINKQRRANRRNAKKSTGPKTDQGKKTAKQNAIKHGLTCRDVVIYSTHLKESESEYQTLVDSLNGELNPNGLFQQQLVLKIANGLWRSRRVILAETAQINKQLDNIDDTIGLIDRFGQNMHKLTGSETYLESDQDKQREIEQMTGERVIPYESHARRLLHYEMRLDRQITRAYKLLRHLQYMELSESSPNQQHQSEKTQNEPISPQPDDLLLLTTE